MEVESTLKGGKMPKIFRYYYGTKEGGRKTVATIKKKYGDDFYQRIGGEGGKHGHTGGFNNPKIAKMAGYKGGRISRRGTNKEPLEIRRAKFREEYPDSKEFEVL